MKRKSKLFRKLLYFFTVILVAFSNFASLVSDNDGSAFVTKAEFDTLRSNFQTQIDSYNNSIDSKIDTAIASYLAGIIISNEEDMDPLLNRLSANRRTFIGNIGVPTTSKQSDLECTTNGYWCVASGEPGVKGATTSYYAGFALAGINNYISGHQKNLVEKGNGGTGKYVFVNQDDVINGNYYFIRDNYLKKLKWQYVSFYEGTMDQGFGSNYYYGGPSSIDLTTVTDNWNGSNSRACYRLNSESGTLQYVAAQESIVLNVSSDSLMSWTENSTGGTVAETNDCGCLTLTDQYNWTYTMTNQHYGCTAQQAYTTQINSGTQYRNSYNGDGNYINISFKVPKITMVNMKYMCQQDVSALAGKANTYYCGLPLCKINKAGKLEIELIAERSNSNGSLVVVLSNGPWENKEITSYNASGFLQRKKIVKGASDWSSNKATVKFTLSNAETKKIVDAGNMLYVKAYCWGEGTSNVYNVKLSVDKLHITYES